MAQVVQGLRALKTVKVVTSICHTLIIKSAQRKMYNNLGAYIKGLVKSADDSVDVPDFLVKTVRELQKEVE